MGKRQPSSSHKPTKSDQDKSQSRANQQSSLKSFFASAKRPRLCRQDHNRVKSSRVVTPTSQSARPLLTESPIQSDFESKETHSTTTGGNSVALSTSNLSSSCLQACKATQKRSTQLRLDCGQRDFGARTICNICGMLYVNCLDEDQTEHEKICQTYKRGVVWNTIDCLVATRKDISIIEIRQDKIKLHKDRLSKIANIVNQELGFVTGEGGNSDPKRTVYIAVQRKRVVGFLSAEPLKVGYVLSENGLERSKLPKKVMVGIHQMWVHAKKRNQGIATLLVNTMRDCLVYGMVIPRREIAFSSPSVAGTKFAQHYQGHSCALVYDCKV